ncbi:hypothetical protein, partial [Mycobacterium tuberculosis]|uniref:hypothetical protein n=1 Tax=Mycobacterium tuberculosis TaxID=1773 RepID=UPI001BE41A80
MASALQIVFILIFEAAMAHHIQHIFSANKGNLNKLFSNYLQQYLENLSTNFQYFDFSGKLIEFTSGFRPP